MMSTKTGNRTSALQYAHDHYANFLEELKEFGSISSVSTDPEAKPEMQHAAEWVAAQLRNLGVERVAIFSTSGHPVIYGEFLAAGTVAPTVLIYGHYDVQPAEPLDLWVSDPFNPAIRGENLYGRGVSDMKGQVMACLKALEAIARTGKIPVNLKFLIEGEEEIGSINLQ